MDELLCRIDREIELCREELAKDTIALVNIKSVRGEPQPGAPFGPGPRAVLDAVLEMGKNAGFYATEYTDSVISIAPEAGKPDLGIWIHGDVVPEGTGWNFEPYRAVEYKGCIIGRGVTDNKGQCCAMFHLLKIFKRLGIQLNYLPAIYVGSGEETGAEDVKDFLRSSQPQKLSLIPDDGFPVGYGGKGTMYLYLRAQKPLQGITILAGQDDDPGLAVATVNGRTITASSLTRHSATPDPNGNMITRLMEKLLEEADVAPEDRKVLEFYKLLSLHIHGAAFDLDVSSAEMTPVAIAAMRVDMVDGAPQLTLKIRNPIELPAETIASQIGAAAKQYGVELVRVERIAEPYVRDKNWPVLCRLAEIANEITGDNQQPYIVGGYTYAHMLPNALVYGTDANVSPADFPEGRGVAHGVDESASLDRLQRAMRIYARALLALDKMDWN
jgi:succinyl-diaminopimelate desuccinylase